MIYGAFPSLPSLARPFQASTPGAGTGGMMHTRKIRLGNGGRGSARHPTLSHHDMKNAIPHKWGCASSASASNAAWLIAILILLSAGFLCYLAS
jgi:hypothetical protein